MEIRWNKKIQVKNGYIYFNMLRAEDLGRLSETIKSVVLENLKGKRPDEKVDSRIGCDRIAEEFDRIFGKGACERTFDTEVPTIFMFDEFFQKFSVLVDQWLKEMDHAG